MAAEPSAPGGAGASNFTGAASNFAQEFARRLARLGLDVIARAIRKDDTSACKVRSGEQRCTIGEFCALIEACGLKMVDRDKVCVDRRAYESMTYIASKALSDQQTSKRLIWDEDQ